jgi:DNA-directed RNA polymerase beta subunit
MHRLTEKTSRRYKTAVKPDSRSRTRTSNCDSIDPDILPVVIDAQIDKRGLAGHHINSFNSFTSHGLAQIVTQLFKIDLSINNERVSTPEDQEIESISISGKFLDARVSRPTTSNYYSGKPEDLKPHQARINKQNYSGPLHIDIAITATAYPRDGGAPRVRHDEIRNYHAANLPILVGSQLCHTAQMPRSIKARINEDQLDPGGYFILKGQEWVIDGQESRVFNSPHIFRNVGHEKEITRLEFISKPGDAYENSSEHIIRYLTDGNIYITITSIDHFKMDVPFYIFFRLMGMVSDQEIFDNIIYRSNVTGGNGTETNTNDVVADHMFEVLEAAIKAPNQIFARASKIIDQTKLIDEFVEATAVFHKTYSGNPIKLDAKTKRYMCSQIITLLDKWMLPHIGVTPESRHTKLRYLGHLIHKMLLVEMQIVDGTDRDHQKGKRINNAGRSFAKAFKRDFNMTIVMPIKKRLRRDFKHLPFSQVNLAQTVQSAIDAPALEKALIQAIVTGDKEMTIKQRTVPNRVASEMLHRKNQLNLLSTLRVVRTASTSSSKQDQRADEMRRAHSSYCGFFCPIQSADTGEQVGMVKQFALGEFTAEPSSSELLKEKLLADPDIIQLQKIYPHQIWEHSLTKILVNGDWIGCAPNASLLHYRYKELRRGIDFKDFATTPVKCDPMIDETTTIHWDTDANELHFWVDAGRMLRPVLIVRNNGELDPYGRAMFGSAYDPFTDTGFVQDVVIDPDTIKLLMQKKLTIDDLYRAGIIDYIAPEESESCYIAPDLLALRDAQTDAMNQYTHVEIPACIMGIAALTSPYAHHNQPPRLTFQTNQVKQTCGWYSLAWPHRIDKHAFLQYYAELPLIKTLANKYAYPNGCNSQTAIASFTGSNQEDSLIYNTCASDRGFVKGVAFGYLQAELEKNEHFGNPDAVQTIEIKNHADYSKIVKGFPPRGSKLTNRDVAIGRFIEIPKPTDRRLYKDTSIIYPHTEPATVERVIQGRDQDRNEFARLKYSAVRALSVGSKFSSRAGQKGVTGAGINQADLMFTENGASPTLTMNPHAIPSRMTVGHLIEGLAGALAALKGIIGDATFFRTTDVESIGDSLEQAGCDRYSNYRMFDGKTGEWMDDKIFMAQTYYQRLQKFVAEEVYSISTGPTCVLTRQPLEGKSNKGGLRIGEMEKDVIVAHGAGHFLMEKFRDDSDGFDIYVCRTCKTIPVVNENIGLVICKSCQESGLTPQVHTVRSTWASKLFLQELEATGVGVQLDLAPYTYEM